MTVSFIDYQLLDAALVIIKVLQLDSSDCAVIG